MVFGDPLIVLESCESTQDEARWLLQTGSLPGTVVRADAMTAGRGRLGRRWQTVSGAGVYLTAVGPSVPLGELWCLTILVGVSVATAINRVTPLDVGLRFPNDLSLGGRKLGGILIETERVGTETYPLIGVGVNVGTESVTESVRHRATSLAHHGGTVTPETLTTEILQQLTHNWQRWRTEGFAPICADWNTLLSCGEARTFFLDGHAHVCTVIGLDSEGTVALRLPSGEVRALPIAGLILGG